MKRSLVIPLLLLSLTGPARAAVGPLPGGELRVAVPACWSLAGTPESSDPGDRLVARGLHAGLTRIDSSGQVRPDLADRWEALEDRRGWRFRLDPKARFHQGGAVTPSDVAASLARLRRQGARTGGWVVDGLIWEVTQEGIVIHGPEDPDLLLHRLAQPAAAILPGGRWNPDEPVGAGPFRFLDAAPGKVILVPNAEHHRGAPLPARLIIGHPDPVGPAPQVVLGQTWPIGGVPPDYQVLRSEGVGSLLLLLSESARGRADPGRLLELLDRETITQAILPGGSHPARGALPPAASSHLPIWEVAPPPRPIRLSDGGASQDELIVAPSAGCGPSAPVHPRLLLALEEIELPVTVEQSKQPDLELMVWLPADLEQELALAEISSLVEWREGSGIARERSLIERAGVVPLVHLDRWIAVSPRVVGLTLTPAGLPILEDVWLAPWSEGRAPQ